ncbi:MAG: hypothetical protein M3R69_09765 [Acidobacteriota bacterium]|nr:hypothetical protein [Acidobacteriota bacterium]
MQTETGRLAQLNGQQSVIDRVLGNQESHREVVVVCGPYGSGVSWTLDRCAENWEAEGGAALEAKGEAFASERRLFPWLTMVLPGAKRQARLEVLKSSLAQSSRAVPIFGSVTSYLVEEVLNHRKRRLAREALLLTEQEQDLLFVVQTIGQDKRLLLTIDDLAFWDEASWSLLGVILSGRLDELYPALSDALILVGMSNEVPPRLGSIVSEKLTELPIRLLESHEITEALLAFDFPVVNDRYQKVLYELTNGRLDLLHDVSKEFREADLANVPSDWSEYYGRLVKRRILGLSEHVANLEGTLIAAAIIGQAFSLSDIACLTDSAINNVTATLRLANKEHFVTSVGDIARFESAELHRYFHKAGEEEHSKYHGKFAECLRLMRPGDYGHRAHHLLLAGNVEDAQRCFAHSALAARREYRAAAHAGDLEASAGWADIRAFLDQMKLAFDAYDDQRIADGLEILEGVEAFLPETLIAERDYLLALFLLSLPSVSSYDRARVLLEEWKELSGREPELWARMAQSLIVAQAQTDHIDEARQLEASLTASYWERRHVDPWALHALNVLRRRSECLHSLPTATQRLESALAYFGPTANETVPRHPIQYYFTLTNLIGNQLASGRFDEALSSALRLEELIRRYTSLPWPGPEIAANNSVLARYLASNIDVNTSADLLLRVTKNSNEAGDRILLQNNSSVLLVRAGRIPEAREIMEDAFTSLRNSEEPDGYHVYFVKSNLASLLALGGEVDRALTLIEECAAIVDQFYPAIHATMKRRQQLIRDAIKEAPALSAEEFDNFLFQKHGMQIGPQWAFYGRGFLLTDIQFWSAD